MQGVGEKDTHLKYALFLTSLVKGCEKNPSQQLSLQIHSEASRCDSLLAICTCCRMTPIAGRLTMMAACLVDNG